MSEPSCPPTGARIRSASSKVSRARHRGCSAREPTDCDGAVFYDAFECDSGAWNDIAVTGCSGSSSSGGSSGSSGGGGSVDAGAKGM